MLLNLEVPVPQQTKIKFYFFFFFLKFKISKNSKFSQDFKIQIFFSKIQFSQKNSKISVFIKFENFNI